MMKLNGLDLASYSVDNMLASFWLANTTASAVVALEAPYVVMNGEEEAMRFDGYVFKSCEDTGELVRLDIIVSVEPQVEETIKGIVANVSTLTKKFETVDTKLEDVDTKFETVEAKAAEIDEKVSGQEEIVTGLSTNVDAIAEKVDGIDTENTEQLVAFARIAIPPLTVDMTTSEIASVVKLLPEWKVGAHYDKGETFTYEGKVYRAAQETPSAQDIYKPGATGTKSLYTLIELAPDGIRVWKTVTDATNSFALGEKCHYPDAEGAIYVSKRDGNTSEPGTDSWWELYEQ